MRLLAPLILASAALLAQLPKPNAEGVAMGHLHIVTPDPEAQRKIWIDVLGAKSVKAGSVEFAMFPGVLVGFRKGESKGGTDGSVVDHLGFLVKDLEAAKAKVTAAGLKIVREMPATRQCFVMFPDSVKVEFTEDTNLDVPIKHHHIHFASHQIEEMRAWYAKHFGAIPGVRGKFQAADLPGVNLSWNPAESAPAPSHGRAMDHIGFEIKDLKAFAAKLEAAGIKFDVPVREVPALGLTIAFLTDPWGAKIELTEGLSRF